MRSLPMVVLVLVFVCFAVGFVYAVDTNETFSQLKSELLQKGVASQDLTLIEKPVKEMLDKGATKDEMKKFVGDLAAKGVNGKNLEGASNSMNELVKSGETPKEAGNVVSQAALSAKAQGLKGNELSEKVREAVRERKAAREELKNKVQKQEKGAKSKAENMQKEKKVQVNKHQKDINKKMKGLGK